MGLPIMPNKRVCVYIDGFNLYHAIDSLDQPHLKWVSLWALSEGLTRPNESLVSVKYFTAFAKWRDAAYRRHQRYIAALEVTGVEPIIGRFKKKTVKCKADCGLIFTTHEEKETDVNIGVHLMADALQDKFDRAMVVSADTDLTAAVRLVRARANAKLIDLIAPPGRMNRSREIRPLFEITSGRVARALFPEKITTKGGKTIIRPGSYSPPA
jgi:uncharacterized LabA/DUF88 family protein